ncbi:F420-dependent oxidoreductase-like protein/probable F420-dependent oxidoreductase [Nocardia tenerifensis]|uniref:F420-dependent oxidoreductase-like protein/probable F420-dependent oxidoreductase n=1 Tax=Nocardia tenerifensis TaxID=228006 RepID=A0A318KNZ1_9NOCA|nr:F420-dependent oxidoreductase-like protein/probable F420-dependent oxidoreductase [Nocardia tenerifensis]
MLDAIVRAEAAGVRAAWVPSWPVGPDGLSIVNAAAARTTRIGLASGISITYPTHPLARANEALVAAELAPGRFRLGIGASHKPEIEERYGLSFGKPLAHLREYVAVLRGMLWEGGVELDGEYYRVHAALPPMLIPPRPPIVLAALRQNMLRLAGEIADGAMLIWSGPSYIRSIARPALEAGARVGQRPCPALIVGANVVPTNDFGTVREVAQGAFSVYATLPTYRKMFQEAGYPLDAQGRLSDEFIHEVVVYGDQDTIHRRLLALHEAGADELAVSVSPLTDPIGEEAAVLEVLARLSP